MLHNMFGSKRVPQSEWFDLSDDDIEQAVNLLEEAHEEVTQFCVLYEPPEPEPKLDPAKGRLNPSAVRVTRPAQNGFTPTEVGWLEQQRLRREKETQEHPNWKAPSVVRTDFQKQIDEEIEKRKAKGRFWE